MQRVQQRNFLQKLQIYNLEESKGLVPTFVVFLTLTTFFPSKIKVHWMQVNTMLKELPEEEFGPIINIREYSFFDNPAVPRQACQNWPHMDGTVVFLSSFTYQRNFPFWCLFQVKESWLDVQLCQAGSLNCNVSTSTSRPGVLKLPKLSSEETVLQIPI